MVWAIPIYMGRSNGKLVPAPPLARSPMLEAWTVHFMFDRAKHTYNIGVYGAHVKTPFLGESMSECLILERASTIPRRIRRAPTIVKSSMLLRFRIQHYQRHDREHDFTSIKIIYGRAGQNGACTNATLEDTRTNGDAEFFGQWALDTREIVF
jgi:hypothetical protein